VKYLVPMTVIFMVGYIGPDHLAGLRKDLMGTRVISARNLGFRADRTQIRAIMGVAIV